MPGRQEVYDSPLSAAWTDGREKPVEMPLGPLTPSLTPAPPSARCEVPSSRPGQTAHSALFWGLILKEDAAGREGPGEPSVCLFSPVDSAGLGLCGGHRETEQATYHGEAACAPGAVQS